MNQLRRFFLQVMIAFALSAAELGGGRGDLPPRYLPVRRRRLYEGFDGEVESARLYVTSRCN